MPLAKMRSIGPPCAAFLDAVANSSVMFVPDQKLRSNSSFCDFTRPSENSLRKIAAQLEIDTPSSSSITACTTQLACITNSTMDRS